MQANIDRRAHSAYFNVMAKLPIIFYPDPILRETAKPVERVDDDMRRLARDMEQTMVDVSGLGLAAPQVGLSLRLFIMNPSRDEEDAVATKTMINPEILERSEEMGVYEEGCLSIPDIYADVERPASVLIRYIDLDGEFREERLEGKEATIAQHEFDHLNGVLFVDHLSRLKRDFLIRKYRKLRRANETV